MIKLITNVIEPVVTECLTFIERYAGLVIPVVSRIQILTDHNDTESTIFVDQFFPVSCELLDTCTDDSFYKKVLPDDSYKSVAYLESLSGADVELSRAKDKTVTANYRLRFVCWLNLAKLGRLDCFATHLYELYFIEAMNRTFSSATDALSNPARVKFTDFRIVRREPQEVFGKYSYGVKEAYFFYPYDFFAVDFTAQVQLNMGCLNPLTIGEPIECLTKW